MKPRRTDSKDNTSAKHDRLRALFEFMEREFQLETLSTKFFPTHSKIETTFVMMDIQNVAKLVSTLTIKEVASQIQIKMITRLCAPDFTPIMLTHPNLTKLMMRYFIKLNGSFRLGYFAIDKSTGNIMFRVSMNSRITAYSVDPQQLKTLIRISITTASFAVRFYIYKTLYMINMLSCKEVTDLFRYVENRPGTQYFSYRKINPDFLTHLRNLKASVADVKDNPQYWNNEERALLHTQTTSNALIVNPIFIYRVDEIRANITSGGFGDLSVVRVAYKLKELDEEVLTRHLVMKEEKSNLRSRATANQPDEMEDEGNYVSNEQLVLKHFQFKASSSTAVAKFYHAEQQNKVRVGLNPNAILMEYYRHKSVDHFRNKYPGISINTKLWFLIQIASGIRFLKDEGVYHLDLKGSNILIQKNYTLKLIDFGESYLKSPHPNLKLSLSEYQKAFTPGRTLPYAAPEVVAKQFKTDRLHDRTDVFSFGMMMGEMLFDDFLVDFKKSNLSVLNKKYQTHSYVTKISKLRVQAMGPKKLFKYLRLIALLCVHPNPSERPTPERLVIMLKEAQIFLDKMY